MGNDSIELNSSNFSKNVSLYEIVINGKASISNLVAELIEEYRTEPDEATLQVINLIISACGCTKEITLDMFVNLENRNIVYRLSEEDYFEDDTTYPIIRSGNKWKKFRANISEFFLILVERCKNSILYDGFLFEKIFSIIASFSDSQIRNFRHTSTLVGLKMMSGVVQIAASLYNSRKSTLRQLETEVKKPEMNQSRERVSILKNKSRVLEENWEAIKSLMKHFRHSVFVHRCYDSVPEIQTLCISELGTWMTDFPEMFITDEYLKNIGWLMVDESAEVRLACLKSLQPLYELEEAEGKLDLFTSKFKDRMIERTLDSCINTSIEAMKLLASLLLYCETFFNAGDLRHIYTLMLSSDRGVASEAGKFVCRHQLYTKDIKETMSKHGKKRSRNTPFILTLLNFVIDIDQCEHVEYLVDALIDKHDALTDWECFIDLLLEEAGPDEECLNSQQEETLLRMLLCCVKQSVSGQPPEGRDVSSVHVSKAKAYAQTAVQKRQLSRILMKNMATLLNRFSADTKMIAHLIQLPQYLDLEVISTGPDKNLVKNLMKSVIEIVYRHSREPIIVNGAKTLDVLCTKGTGIYSECDVARSALLDDLVDTYSKEKGLFLNTSDADFDSDEIFNLILSIQRVAIFYGFHDFGTYDRVWDSLFSNIDCDNDVLFPNLHVLIWSIKGCFAGILWGIEKMNLLSKDSKNELEAFELVFSTKLMKFLQSLKMLTSAGTQPDVRSVAFSTLCLILIRIRELLKYSAGFHSVLCCVDENCGLILSTFLNDRVFDFYDDFNEKTKTIDSTALSGRRNLLSDFCQLMKLNGLPYSLIGTVVRNYIAYNKEFGDIIKDLISEIHEKNSEHCAEALMMCLIDDFEVLFDSEQGVSEHDREFVKIKELARRFSLFFGVDLKSSKFIVPLHRRAIAYIFSEETVPMDIAGDAPHRALFFDVVNEFTMKLNNADKKQVLAYLDQHIMDLTNVINSCPMSWRQMYTYRYNLVSDKKIATREQSEATDNQTEYRTPAESPVSHPASVSRRSIVKEKRRTKPMLEIVQEIVRRKSPRVKKLNDSLISEENFVQNQEEITASQQIEDEETPKFETFEKYETNETYGEAREHSETYGETREHSENYGETREHGETYDETREDSDTYESDNFELFTESSSKSAKNSSKMAGNSLKSAGNSLKSAGSSSKMAGNSLKSPGSSSKMAGNSLKSAGNTYVMAEISKRNLEISGILKNSENIMKKTRTTTPILFTTFEDHSSSEMEIEDGSQNNESMIVN